MNIDRDNYEAWLLDRLEGRLTADQERALDAFLADNPDLREKAGQMDLPRIDAELLRFSGADDLKRAIPPVGLVNAATVQDHLIARGEGDLDPQQRKALERFLYEHPEHERTARLLDVGKVGRDEVAMPGRELLQKHFPPLGAPDRARITDFLIAAHEGDLDAARIALLRKLVASDAALQREERLVKAARVQPAAEAFPMKERLKKREARVVPLWSIGGGAVRWAAAASVLLLLGLAWWTLREAPQAGGEVARNEVPAPAPTPPVNGREAAAPGEPAVPVNGTQDRNVPAVPATATAKRTSPERAGGARTMPAPQEVPVEGPALAQVPVPAPDQAPKQALPVPGPDAEPILVAEVPQEPPARTQAAAKALTVGELFASNVRERVLGQPADERPLDRSDAVALADKGLKGITGGPGGVQVQRTSKRDRFKVRLGEGLAFSGSIGR